MVAFFLHFLTPLGLSSLVTALALVPHGNSLVRERGFMPHSTARHGWSSPHTRGKKNDDDDELQQGPPEALQAEENEWSTPDSQPPPRLSVLKRQRSETPRHDYALDAVSPEVPGAAPRHDYAFDLITPNLPATPPTRPRRSQDFNRFSRQPPYLDNATSSKPGVRQVAGSEEPSEANIPPVGLSLQAKKDQNPRPKRRTLPSRIQEQPNMDVPALQSTHASTSKDSREHQKSPPTTLEARSESLQLTFPSRDLVAPGPLQNPVDGSRRTPSFPHIPVSLPTPGKDSSGTKDPSDVNPPVASMSDEGNFEASNHDSNQPERKPRIMRFAKQLEKLERLTNERT